MTRRSPELGEVFAFSKAIEALLLVLAAVVREGTAENKPFC
jgi:hypothetical protein